jgi:hypothetical protein
VPLKTDPTQHDFPARDTGIPTYDGLPLDRYVSILEMLNPMHRSGRRALEQDHHGARLLLEEVFVLRRVARLHRPLTTSRPPISS